MVMKNILLFLIVLFPFLGFSQTKADDILGVWLTQIKDANIEIYKKENKYYGRVIWIAEPLDENGKPVVDIENPNPKLQNRPILKMDILIGFSYEDGEWVGGKIYDPKDGETYNCKLWIENGTLKVRGYLGWLFDTKTWTRVSQSGSK